MQNQKILLSSLTFTLTISNGSVSVEMSYMFLFFLKEYVLKRALQSK